MKKLIFILLIVVFSSCVYNKVDDTTVIPNNVIEQVNKADSLIVYRGFVIKTREYHYYFNEKKELVEVYEVNPVQVSIHVGVLIILCLLLIVFLVLLSVSL